MKFFNSTEPLGLPRGSIRAILALAIVFVFAGRLAAGFAIDPTLVAILTLVLRDYFQSRTDESARTPNEPTLPEPLVG